jgi:hypothetical protein
MEGMLLGLIISVILQMKGNGKTKDFSYLLVWLFKKHENS